MHVGSPTLCLRARRLDASRRFYEALGMEVVDEVPGVRVVLRRGTFSLALMTFLDENWLNFRGADVFAVHAFLRDRGLGLEGAPERYSREQHGADAAGACWSTRDPEGNVIFFDTNETETGERAARERLAQLLRHTEQELSELGADECLGAFRREIFAKFALPGRQDDERPRSHRGGAR
jgi:catechol 2,3-dioxygenase-like lactoylglutathione lyase family enzyme